MKTDNVISTARVRVAIQGVAGCFHDSAAREFFAGKNVEVVTEEYNTFPLLFDALAKDDELLGIVAIENTIAGSILANHELLRASDRVIVGEWKKRISHVLCALPGQTLESIREVNSHPMALMQCGQWLEKHPLLRAVEHFDTAGSARDIANGNLRGHAAICGTLAAEIYGLDILAAGIETDKRNFTRFLVLASSEASGEFLHRPGTIDKASIEFTLPHTKGALSAVLAILSFYDMNLSKIQSTPIIGREWEYRFFVDLTFDNITRYRQAVEAIRPLTNELRILGEYREYADPRQRQ